MSTDVTRLERIQTTVALDGLRELWNALYARDPHAQVFLSWAWLRAYLPAGRYRWSILVLRDDAQLIAALPLALSAFPSTVLPLDRELHLGGSPAGDYTGMLCLPGHENEALDAFAGEIAASGWDNFNLNDTVGPAMGRLAPRIAHRVGGTSAELIARTCHAIALPATWEEYLAGQFNAKQRKNTLRAQRRLAELPGFRATEATAADADRHIEAVLALKRARFGGRMSRFRLRYGRFFRNAFDTGVLRLFAFWDGDRPISAAAVFVDPQKRTFSSYMRGHAREYDSYGPGRAMIAHLIERAIADGYATFDFLRGNEPYKLDFTNTETTAYDYRVTRPGLRARAINAARPAFLQLKLLLANVAFGGGRSL